MDGKIAATLERPEERIEHIKWLLTATFPAKRPRISGTITAIRRSAGILGKNTPRGTAFETGIRKTWRSGFSRRVS